MVGRGPADLRLATLGLVIPAVYLAGLTAVAAVFARELPLGSRARVPFVLAAMHLSWGAGFLTSPRRLAVISRGDDSSLA